eukprot:scaffold13819_cov22-Tisochrysis_lutea.AAC.1
MCAAGTGAQRGPAQLPASDNPTNCVKNASVDKRHLLTIEFKWCEDARPGQQFISLSCNANLVQAGPELDVLYVLQPSHHCAARPGAAQLRTC